MREARFVLGLVIFVSMFLFRPSVLRSADEPVPDSPEVSELLVQAKAHAAQLAKDADWMRFGMLGATRESHSLQIDRIKDHVNKMGRVLKEMRERREWASPWQQAAVDRITPLARELATNIASTIDHLKNNQGLLRTPAYKDYLEANEKLASNLSALISDFASYGKNRAGFQRLERQLELSR